MTTPFRRQLHGLFLQCIHARQAANHRLVELDRLASILRHFREPLDLFALIEAAAGLKDSGIELTGAGFLTEGVTEAQGEAAEGMRTTLHYADTLDNNVNDIFRRNYKEMWGKEADVYAVQGYDAAELIRIGLEAVEGDMGARSEMIAAMEGAIIDSPRGPLKLSAAHNPVQNFYLRKVVNGVNTVERIAVEALSDPAKGCSMG